MFPYNDKNPKQGPCSPAWVRPSCPAYPSQARGPPAQLSTLAFLPGLRDTVNVAASTCTLTSTFYLFHRLPAVSLRSYSLRCSLREIFTDLSVKVRAPCCNNLRVSFLVCSTDYHHTFILAGAYLSHQTVSLLRTETMSDLSPFNLQHYIKTR